MKKHLPNAVTCLNLISGCIATLMAFQGDYSMALLMIVIGAVFDFFDGMTARLLHVSSPIGKELDSLADCITFGLAPSAMAFTLLSHSTWAQWVWLPFVSFLMAAFSALRLAKFNLDERQTMGFIGLPTPANALFWASLIVSAEEHLTALPALVCALLLLSCWLLVCELPMFALKFKHWGWKGNEVRYTFIVTALLLIVVLGVMGIAAAILWYVLLSLLVVFRGRKA